MVIFHIPDDKTTVCPIKTNDLNGKIFIGSYQCRMCEHNIAIDTDSMVVKCGGKIDDTSNLFSNMYQKPIRNPRILYIPVKERWFKMHSSREKLIDYRDLKRSWFNKLFFSKDGFDDPTMIDEIINDMKFLHTTDSLHTDLQELMDYYNLEFREYDFISYRNGYGKNVPEIIVKFSAVDIGVANPKWIDENSPNVNYFRIWDGELVQVKNDKK